MSFYNNPEPVAYDTPLYNSRILNNYIEYLKKFYPEVDIRPILDYAGVTVYEIEDPAHWFNQRQCDRFHEILSPAAELVLSRTTVLCGIGIIEDAYDRLAEVEVIAPERIMTREKVLLQEAKRVMGRILMDATSNQLHNQ